MDNTLKRAVLTPHRRLKFPHQTSSITMTCCWCRTRRLQFPQGQASQKEEVMGGTLIATECHRVPQSATECNFVGSFRHSSSFSLPIRDKNPSAQPVSPAKVPWQGKKFEKDHVGGLLTCLTWSLLTLGWTKPHLREIFIT